MSAHHLDAARVRDAMSAPVRAVDAAMPLEAVARLMARERIHCVAVLAEPAGGGGEPAVLGVLSDLDLVGALDAGTLRTAGDAAGEPLESIPADAPLRLAVHQMRQARAHHLVVVARDSGRPVGILSTLDVARVAAGPASGPAEGS